MSNKTWLFVSSNPENESTIFEWMVNCCFQQNIKLNIVVVLPKLSHSVFEWIETQQNQGVIERQIENEKNKRQKWIDLAIEQQVDLTINVRFGKLFYEVIQVVGESNVELLVKQTDDLEQKEGFLFQSMDWYLLRKSPVPLLLYRENTSLPFENIMVSLDVDIDTQPYEPTEFNQSLLTWADRFKKDKAVKIVHAWQSEIENLVKHWDTDLSETNLIDLNEQIYFEHKKALNSELRARAYGNEKPTVFYCKGESAESISQAVTEQNTDLLVLGTVGRSGVLGLIIGNTAEDLLERVNCSVLAIKPNTIVSK